MGKLTCSCISYNQPKPHQTVPSRILAPPRWANSSRDGICVDECIADVVLALWDARVWTMGSCCGHGDVTRRAIIVDRSEREKAAKVVRDMGDDAQILAWELVAGDSYAPRATGRR